MILNFVVSFAGLASIETEMFANFFKFSSIFILAIAAIASDDRKHFQCLNIFLNNYTQPFLKFH